MKDLSYNLYKIFFRAVSNKTRFEIIRLLREGSKSVGQIVDELGFEQSRVSHNLKRLEHCGFVSCKWQGKNRVYSLDKEDIVPILDRVDKHIIKYGRRLKVCSIIDVKRNK